MIPPKTDWTAADCFELEDYNRIVSNLNELAAAKEVTSALAAGTHATILTGEDRGDIADVFNAVMYAAGLAYSVEAYRGGYWFNAAELNIIETGCMMATRAPGAAAYNAGLIFDTGAKYGGGVVG